MASVAKICSKLLCDVESLLEHIVGTITLRNVVQDLQGISG